MRNKDAIVISYLIENKGRKLNINMLAREMKIDYKNAYSIIKRLEKESLVRLESFGKASRIKLALKMHPIIFEAEYNRKAELLKNKNLAVMQSGIKKGISSKCYVHLLFGSYAKKTQTKNSDIDLMFIVPDGKAESFEKEINRTARSLPLPIHYLVFTEKQFLDMVDAKGSNVGKEAQENNIILYGIETYYEMLV